MRKTCGHVSNWRRNGVVRRKLESHWESVTRVGRLITCKGNASIFCLVQVLTFGAPGTIQCHIARFSVLFGLSDGAATNP